MKYGYTMRTEGPDNRSLYVHLVFDVSLSNKPLYHSWINDHPDWFENESKTKEFLNAIDNTSGVEKNGLVGVEGHNLTVRLLNLGIEDKCETVNKIVKKVQRRFYPKGDTRCRYNYVDLSNWLLKINRGGKRIFF